MMTGFSIPAARAAVSDPATPVVELRRIERRAEELGVRDLALAAHAALVARRASGAPVVRSNGRIARTRFMETILRVRMNVRAGWGGINSRGDVVLCSHSPDFEEVRLQDRIEGLWLWAPDAGGAALARSGRRPVGATERHEHVKMLRSGAQGFILLALTEHTSDAEAPTRVSSSQYEDAFVWRVERVYEDVARAWLADTRRIPLAEYERYLAGE